MSKKKERSIENFVPINRKFFRHPFWREKRTFSKSEAWLDLIQAARFEDSTANELIGGKLVSWQKGQLPASLRYLADRWSWGKDKVNRFLIFLEKENMISRSNYDGQSIISLKNFHQYNGVRHRTRQQNEEQLSILDDPPDTDQDTGETVARQWRDKTNTVNTVNTEENILSASANAPQDEKENLESFDKLQKWILDKTPRVAKMKKPLTFKQFVKLKEGFSKQQIADMLKKMENYRPLLQKNISTYQTFLNWAERNFTDKQASEVGTINPMIAKMKAAERRANETAR